MSMTDLSLRVSALEERVESLEKGRSGRRGKPILVSLEGICGVDPKRDSSECPDASLYRRQKGCKGTGCVLKSSEYYQDYRVQQEAQVATPKRKRRV